MGPKTYLTFKIRGLRQFKYFFLFLSERLLKIKTYKINLYILQRKSIFHYGKIFFNHVEDYDSKRKKNILFRFYRAC